MRRPRGLGAGPKAQAAHAAFTGSYEVTMPHIRLSRVGFSYPGSIPIFSDVTFDISSGWSAVAGPNGAGKTTLLRLMAGELAPTTGHVASPASCARVRQVSVAPTPAVCALAESWDSDACRLRARWQLEPDDLARWHDLSGGERQRWQIAAALASGAEVILLDEPTNHLDSDARANLARRLAASRALGVVVSHDRSFLDALVERVLWVDDGAVRIMPGTYSEVRARMTAEHDSDRARLREANRERDRLQRELHERARRAASSERAISSRSRMKNAQDRDGRAMARKYRAERAAHSHSRTVDRMRERVHTAAKAARSIPIHKGRYGDISVGASTARTSRVLRLDLPTRRAGDRTLWQATVVQVHRDDRIRIAGPNGAGKTTLLRTLAASWSHAPQRLLYLPQDDPDGAHVLATIRALDPQRRGHALSIASALGLSVERILAANAPSPGETRKLMLARGLACDAWLVVLDEPTNHLDLPSIERLEAALSSYPGAIVIATHDDALANSLACETWTLGDGRLERANGPMGE